MASSGVIPQKALPNGKKRRLAHPCDRLELGVLPRYTFAELPPRLPENQRSFFFRTVVRASENPVTRHHHLPAVFNGRDQASLLWHFASNIVIPPQRGAHQS